MSAVTDPGVTEHTAAQSILTFCQARTSNKRIAKQPHMQPHFNPYSVRGLELPGSDVSQTSGLKRKGPADLCNAETVGAWNSTRQC